MSMEGYWRRQREPLDFGDPAQLSERTRGDKPFMHMEELHLGEVNRVNPEPIFNTVTAAVTPRGGGQILNVNWPGPNVCVGPSGQVDGSRLGIHGLYESPMPGQKVALGYIRGSVNNPVVLQKYSTRINEEPHNNLHQLPLTSTGHSSDDIVLGNYKGAFMALRGTFPVPAEIEINTPSDLYVSAKAGVEIVTPAVVSITASSFTVNAPSCVIGAAPTDFAVLGTALAALLTELITLVANASVPTPAHVIGTSPLSTAGDIAALAGDVPGTLSSTVLLGV